MISAEPQISYHPREQLWELMNDVIITSLGYTFTLRAGQKSDLASIPRVLWFIVGPMEDSVAAPLLHDLIYAGDGLVSSDNVSGGPRRFTRAEADRFLYDVAKQEDVWWWRRAGCYRALRLIAPFRRKWNPKPGVAT